MDAQALRVQVGRQAPGPLGHLGVGEPAVPPDDAFTVGQSLDQGVEGLGQVELHGLDCSGGSAAVGVDDMSAPDRHPRALHRGLRGSTGVLSGVPPSAMISPCRETTTAVTVVRNPATGEVITSVPSLSEPEVDAAIARAAAAFETGGTWRPGTGPACSAASPPRSTPTARSWPALEVANAGHVIGNARWEAGNVRDVLEYYAAAPERHSGRQIPVPGGVDLTFHEPLGVVGIIVPWNFPMAIAGWGFAPRWPPATPWSSSRPS